MECPDIRFYACGRKSHAASNCEVNRACSDSGGHNRRYSPERYSPGRGSSQYNDDKSAKPL